ncbi:hypothetical protein [Streptosporangium roseum]|uniref:hypothetical protein n=1 Tax=Streptosporangium roseum TaxID=2001 RepID=UPI0004CD7F6A|nr:hypothetical protein [Streptosporangium roseum]
MTNPISFVHPAREAKALAAATAALKAESKVALDTLKTSCRLVPSLMTAVAIVTTAVANVDGMGDARANWQALAKELEVKYPGVIGNAVFLCRGDWQADDREAFLASATTFGSELQKLSGICYSMEGKIDAVREAYYDYWKQIAALSGIVLIYILAVVRMSTASPATVLAAQVQLKRLSAITNGLVGKVTAALGAYLALAGHALAALGGKFNSMSSIKPTGGLKIDFQKAEISTKPPSTWIAPKREIGAVHKDAPDPQVDKVIDGLTPESNN